MNISLLTVPSLQKLNSQGVAHYIIPLIAVLLTGVVGTYMLVASHANRSLPAPNDSQYSSSAATDQLTGNQAALPGDLQLQPGSVTLPDLTNQKYPQTKAKAKAAKANTMVSRSKIISRGRGVAQDFWGKVTNRPICSESRRGKSVRTYTVAVDLPNTLAYTYLNGRAPTVKSHDCTIYISTKHFPSRLNLLQAYTLCTIIVHEYGHLYGYGHSSDPHNVMYPTDYEPGKASDFKLQRCVNAVIR